MKALERIFEGILWNSRFIVLFAVIACLGVAVGIFYMATVDSWIMLTHLFHYASLDEATRLAERANNITHVVEIIDGYLLATVLLIFSLGLYELFISKIQQAEDSERAPKVLLISDLDDLKSRLAKVILMILIVRFFELALRVQHFASGIDMIYFSGGIALIGLALYLSHAGEHGIKSDH